LEWHLDASDLGKVRELRHEFTDYLAARAGEHSDLAAAEVAFAELVANVHRHALGPASIQLDWRDETPILTVSDAGPGFTPEIALPDPTCEGGRGLYLVTQLVGEVTVRDGPDRGARVSVQLPIRRAGSRAN
jgi:anti-sigma regulatory factor (Ser/Thr protein kinase)